MRRRSKVAALLLLLATVTTTVAAAVLLASQRTLRAHLPPKWTLSGATHQLKRLVVRAAFAGVGVDTRKVKASSPRFGTTPTFTKWVTAKPLVWVVSLPRSTQRRAFMEKQFLRQAPQPNNTLLLPMSPPLRVTFIEALDGANDAMPLREMETLFGLNSASPAKRLIDAKWLNASECCVSPIPEHAVAESRRREKGYVFRSRAKIATDLTYYTLLTKMRDSLSNEEDIITILEDDVLLRPSPIAFPHSLINVVASLPLDWDILSLRKTYPPGPQVGANAHVLRSGFGTVGFVLRRKAVPRILSHLREHLRRGTYVDLVMFGMMPELGQLDAYVVGTDLVTHVGDVMGSTMLASQRQDLLRP